MQGQPAEGIALIRKGYEAYRAIEVEQWRPVAHAVLAEACLRGGRIEDGLHTIDEAFILVEKTGERFWETELYRLKGELLLAQPAGNHAEAETCFCQAIEIARKKEMKSFELKAAMSLSRLWLNQGKRNEARKLLCKSYDWFPEGLDTPYLQDAKTLIKEIS